jgi:hypothetical protein
MSKLTMTFFMLILCCFSQIVLSQGNERRMQGPLRIHPGNPRYFTDNSGRAIWLAGSHTWANFQERGVEGETPDFDYPGHLDFLADYGHNFMRLWRWEHAQWMQFVSSDTLIRYEPMAYLRPGPGLALDGKPRYDLSQFNPAYFDRLRKRVVAADQRGIYVSVMMFQGFSVEQKGTKGVDPTKGNAWCGHPYHVKNNVNNINGDLNRDDEGDETHTLADSRITALQEAYVRKVIDTLNDLDNVLWEISNESHTRSIDWHTHMIEFIKSYEATKPNQHLIGMTGSPITNPPMFASPADWISPKGSNYLNDPPDVKGAKIIIVDNDHIRPWDSMPQWVWKNLMRGNHFILMDHYMDFRIDSPDTPDLKHNPTRKAMGLAVKLANRVDLAAMSPERTGASTGYCLANPGREYLIYQPQADKPFTVQVKPGRYQHNWLDCTTGLRTEGAPVNFDIDQQTFTPSLRAPMILHLRRVVPARNPHD